jgi:hypothetical protein
MRYMGDVHSMFTQTFIGHQCDFFFTSRNLLKRASQPKLSRKHATEQKKKLKKGLGKKERNASQDCNVILSKDLGMFKNLPIRIRTSR